MAFGNDSQGSQGGGGGNVEEIIGTLINKAIEVNPIIMKILENYEDKNLKANKAQVEIDEKENNDEGEEWINPEEKEVGMIKIPVPEVGKKEDSAKLKAEIIDMINEVIVKMKRYNNKNENSIREVMEIIGEAEGPTIRDCFKEGRSRTMVLSDKIDKMAVRIEHIKEDILGKLNKSLACKIIHIYF